MVSQRELRNDLDAILRAAESGVVVVMTRNGIRVRLLPPVDGRRFRDDVDALRDQSTEW